MPKKQFFRVGISGWTFPEWRGIFYPKNVKQKDELFYTSRALNSIEINGTFYSMQKPHTFVKWYDETPGDFVFAIKAPKYITHERRLKEFETPLANFLASGLLCLKEKLGVILWQFPPTLPFIPDRFEAFMAALPHSMEEAATLSKGHSDWMSERCVTTSEYQGRLRHAIETRHESFKCKEFIEMLRKYRISVVVGDTEGRWPYMEDVTSDFLYVRLHGDETKYPDGYTRQALDHWETRLSAWASGGEPKDAQTVVKREISKNEGERIVFAFFDNDNKKTAPANAIDMTGRLKIMREDEIIVVEPPKIAVSKKTAATKAKKVSPKKPAGAKKREKKSIRAA